MYSLGIFLRPSDTKDPKCKYFFLADAKCRSAKTAIPCRSSDRGHVNKHHKKSHELVEVTFVTKHENKEARKGTNEKSFHGSKNSAAGTDRWVSTWCVSYCAHHAWNSFSFRCVVGKDLVI